MTAPKSTRRDRFRKWLLVSLYALGVAGYGLIAPLPLIVDTDSRVFSVPYRGFFLGLALIIILAAFSRRGGLYKGRFWWPFSLFWGIYVTRLFVDTIVSPLPLRLPIAEYYLLAFGMVLIPTIAFFAMLKPDANRSAMFATLILSVLACVANYYLGIDALLSGLVYRLGTETLNPVSFGYLGATAVILASFAWLKLERGGLLNRALLLGSVIVGLLAIGFAGSRGPVSALAATLLVLLIHSGAQAGIRRAFVFAVALFAIASAALLYVVEMGSGLIERVEITGLGLDPSDEDRFWLWQGAWASFLENPVLGSGVEVPDLGFYPHSMILEGYMATGLIGGSLLLFMMLYAGKRAVDLLSLSPDYGWLGLLYIQQLIGAIFSGSIYGSTGLWYFMAAVITTEWAQRPVRTRRNRTRANLGAGEFTSTAIPGPYPER